MSSSKQTAENKSNSAFSIPTVAFNTPNCQCVIQKRRWSLDFPTQAMTSSRQTAGSAQFFDTLIWNNTSTLHLRYTVANKAHKTCISFCQLLTYRTALMIEINIITIFYENINARTTEILYLNILVLFNVKKNYKNDIR